MVFRQHSFGIWSLRIRWKWQGRFAGVSVNQLDQLRSAWNARVGDIFEFGEIRWLRAQNLSGPAGATGGNPAEGNSFIVIDGNGGGFKQLSSAALDQLVVVDGDLNLTSGSGKISSQEVTIKNTGTQDSEWRVIWDLDEGDYSLETAIENLAINPQSYLELVPKAGDFLRG